MRNVRAMVVLISLSACAAVCAQTPPVRPATDSYVANVQPFVNKYCIACHNGKKEAGGLDLTLFRDTASVVKSSANWAAVKDRLDAREMPPKKHPEQPTAAEAKRIVEWIDREFARAIAATPRSPGRVTMRRLNRDEYNRTIRDLVGVDFQPANDFPTDDVGHGFDNIGDVLSMPPILLEKYLNAAESIVTRAFEGEAAPQVTRRFGVKELQTTTAKTDVVDVRFEKARWLAVAGTVFIECDIPRAGELIFRVRVAPKNLNDKESLRLAFRVDDKDVRTQPFRSQNNNPNILETKTTVTAGRHKIAVALLNPDESDKPLREKRGAAITWIEVLDPPLPRQRPAYDRIMIGNVKDESKDRANEIFGRFAFRAWRRPVTQSELGRLVSLYELAIMNGATFEQAIASGLQAVLVSPHFLFRVETDRTPDRPDRSYSLNDWEIASRLSYFLWSSMPDDALFQLAKEGKLRDGSVRAAQVKRMLHDPKAAALAQNFAGQWLNLRLLASIQPARRDFPSFDESLRIAMQQETEKFFHSVVVEDRSVLEFLDADFSFLNERLAKHYGISGISGEAFQRVMLTDGRRGGVLTHASILTLTSNPTRTSPVKRGKWILENILGTPPPPPPPDVPDLEETKEAIAKGTLRERMQQHRANPNCATCHERMDTLGFGFENFDAIGGWRSNDGKFTIDASGVLPDGKKFSGPAELKKILKSTKANEFRRCLTEKLLTYALGRGIGPGDRPTVEAISQTVAANGNRMERLVLEIVQSDAFLRRSLKQ
jgi:mono/diheme cytochrome c family protein